MHDFSCNCTVYSWKLSSKVAQVLEMLKRLSSSQTGRVLSLLQLSRAVSTGEDGRVYYILYIAWGNTLISIEYHIGANFAGHVFRESKTWG